MPKCQCKSRVRYRKAPTQKLTHTRREIQRRVVPRRHLGAACAPIGTACSFFTHETTSGGLAAGVSKQILCWIRSTRSHVVWYREVPHSTVHLLLQYPFSEGKHRIWEIAVRRETQHCVTKLELLRTTGGVKFEACL